MEKNDAISSFPKNKYLHYKKYFLKNIFDEKFLDEKDKALRPIVLSDKIQGETIKKSKKKKAGRKKRSNFNENEEKYIKYGSNIVYIDSKIDENDNDDKFHALLNDQIFKIISEESTF